jgi:hypothetical protein
MTAEYARSFNAARVTTTSPIVVIVHAIQNHPSNPA